MGRRKCDQLGGSGVPCWPGPTFTPSIIREVQFFLELVLEKLFKVDDEAGFMMTFPKAFGKASRSCIACFCAFFDLENFSRTSSRKVRGAGISPLDRRQRDARGLVCCWEV